MKDEIESLIRKSAEGTRSTRVTADDLASQFDHQVLFDVVSDYMNNPSVSRLEWIICIRTLCRIDHVEANKRFVQALQVDDSDKRFRIVKLLSAYGTEHIVPTLMDMLKNDAEPGIRFMVAITLGAIGDKRAIPALEWSIENDDGVNHEGTPISYRAKQAIERLNADSD